MTSVKLRVDLIVLPLPYYYMIVTPSMCLAHTHGTGTSKKGFIAPQSSDYSFALNSQIARVQTIDAAIWGAKLGVVRDCRFRYLWSSEHPFLT